MRRHRVRGRLDEDRPPPLARSRRPLEARLARGDHRDRRARGLGPRVLDIREDGDAGPPDRGFSTSIYVPLIDVDVPLSYAWYVLAFFIIAGASNGVNLTDGIDGLAAGTTTIAILTYTAMSLVAALTAVRRGAPADPIDLDQAIHGASLIGASIGFLWYNAFPAQVFMGDTGSMGLGGALAAFAIMTKTELLLLLIGGIFLVEALSVILQVLSYKWLGRRVFLMAPLHHHFEMKAWSETRIMVRFWIATAILCACGFVLYYAYFSNFNNLAS